MSEEQIPAPTPESDETAKPAKRKAAPRASRKKAEAAAVTPAAEAIEAAAVTVAEATEAAAVTVADAAAPPAKPKPKRAPRKAKAATPPVVELPRVDDLFAEVAVSAPVVPEPAAPAQEAPAVSAAESAESAAAEPAAPAPPESAAPLPDAAPAAVSAEPAEMSAQPQRGLFGDTPKPTAAPHTASYASAEFDDDGYIDPATAAADAEADARASALVNGTPMPRPAAPNDDAQRRNKRKRRRGKPEREALPADSAAPARRADADESESESAEAEFKADAEAEAEFTETQAVVAPAEVIAPAPLTVVSLGLDKPPVLCAAALAALAGARVILGTADALDRLAGLALAAPQQLCAADSAHLELHAVGHAGSVLVVVGDGAGDGPATELLAELGPERVRLFPGVGRVQAACAALGLSAEVVEVVDLRRAPLAALRGRLRAHHLFALPLADASRPLAVARLLLDSGFPQARVWVCEFASGGLEAKAWLASELVELRDPIDPHAVLILATGASTGHFAELPGLSDDALGLDACAALPLAARLVALAWLQPAAWECGWSIGEGEASLALEWARAVPTARIRAVGMDPTLLGVAMARAGVGENLAAIASASPAHAAEWPAPAAVFIRGGAGLPEWLAAAWARLAPGGRLVASAEDDQARADLLAFSSGLPASAWQELSLANGESVAGRLRFTPSAAVRLALWQKPA